MSNISNYYYAQKEAVSAILKEKGASHLYMKLNCFKPFYTMPYGDSVKYYLVKGKIKMESIFRQPTPSSVDNSEYFTPKSIGWSESRWKHEARHIRAINSGIER